MKKVIKKKLELNKNTISSLNNQQLGQIEGGTDMIEVVGTDILVGCTDYSIIALCQTNVITCPQSNFIIKTRCQ